MKTKTLVQVTLSKDGDKDTSVALVNLDKISAITINEFGMEAVHMDNGDVYRTDYESAMRIARQCNLVFREKPSTKHGKEVA